MRTHYGTFSSLDTSTLRHEHERVARLRQFGFDQALEMLREDPSQDVRDRVVTALAQLRQNNDSTPSRRQMVGGIQAMSPASADHHSSGGNGDGTDMDEHSDPEGPDSDDE